LGCFRAQRPHDIVIFGASGYTGQFVIEYVARAAKEDNLKWAVAGKKKGYFQNKATKVTKCMMFFLGRDVSKLTEALASASANSGFEGLEKSIPMIQCDVKNEESIREMARSTRLVLNCVGPYRFFGEVVVRACVENGTHHVDISGKF
jgi:short subunit dehydrogenase-like uncharacterized protein